MLPWGRSRAWVMARIFSPQQTAAIEAISDNNKSLVIEAVAGAGKTTTLIEMVKATSGTVQFCAFNKSIANEIEAKISTLNLGNRVKVGTLHSVGFSALRNVMRGIKVNGNKLRDIARNEFFGDYYDLQQFVIDTAGMAKEVGIGPLLDINNDNSWYEMCEHYSLWDSLPEKYNSAQGIDAARYLLNASNNNTSVIDFSDMIYMPILKKVRTIQYDYVFLDEAQDTNPTRRALVRLILKPQGRLIAVGDPCQAIYGFTGADHKALDNIREEFNAETLPLTVTYRCPKAVVSTAQQWVSHIEAHESAPDGIVDSCDLVDISSLVSADDAILCRTTKPLVELAYGLIRKSIPCRVAGRDIGKGLIRIISKWKTVKTVGQLQDKLEEWSTAEINKHKAKGNDNRCQVIEDQVQTIMVFIEQCDNSDSISVLIKNIESLFGDIDDGRNVLTLSTIHKSKGREWRRVFALGMDTYSPSKWARKEWEMVQENNLCYVQVTRAMEHLTLVKVPDKIKD